MQQSTTLPTKLNEWTNSPIVIDYYYTCKKRSAVESKYIC